MGLQLGGGWFVGMMPVAWGVVIRNSALAGGVACRTGAASAAPEPEDIDAARTTSGGGRYH